MVFEAVFTRKLKKKATISAPDDAYRLVKHLVKDKRQENVFIITMDNISNVIGVHVVHIGTDHQTMFSVKDIFYHAIMDNAHKIIVFHNHPGPVDISVGPSQNDIKMAQKIYKAGTIMSIIVQDVMVISEHGYSSIKPSYELVHKGEIRLV
jgi:DNA repair protein RadC